LAPPLESFWSGAFDFLAGLEERTRFQSIGLGAIPEGYPFDE